MDNHDSVMIALLPTASEWCQIELPHMTLVYAGLVKDLKPTDFNALAKDAASIALLTGPFCLPVISKEVFGDEEKVDVFRLRPTMELWALRRHVERWNASQHEFNPHVTIGPQNSFVEFPPRHVCFDRVVLGWGDEIIPFHLSRR